MTRSSFFSGSTSGKAKSLFIRYIIPPLISLLVCTIILGTVLIIPQFRIRFLNSLYFYLPSAARIQGYPINEPRTHFSYDASGNGQPFHNLKGTCQPYEGEWVRLPRTEICINSAGFRDYEISLEPGKARIMMFGDSFTFGVGINQEDTIPKKVEEFLRGDGIGYEVLNLGIPGSNLEDQVSFLKQTGLRYSPHKVVFLFDNDDLISWRDERPRLEQAVEEEYSERPLEPQAKIRSQVIRFAARVGLGQQEHSSIEEVASILNPLIEALMNLSEEHDFSVTIFEFRAYPNQEAVLQELSDKYDFTLHRLHWEDRPNSSTFDGRYFLHPLDRHTTPYANEIIAREIVGSGLLN